MQTNVCRLLGIDVPIVLAPFGPWDQVELAAAVCSAGALGSLGTAIRSPDELRGQWRRLQELTDRPFAVNHTGRPFNPDAFEATLELAPAAISFHMGIPGARIRQAHDHGITWIQTVGDEATATAALEAGADILIAQGGEAGGNAGWVGTLALVPAVVDLAGEVPVVAAGGIADGRGIAAAFALGAQGVSLGTRFLATPEMSVAEVWKHRIVDAATLDAVKVAHAERVMPPFNLPQLGPAFAPRSLRTPLTDALETAPETVEPEIEGARLVEALRNGGGHDMLPFTGQSAGLVHDIVPAVDLIHRMMREAEAAAERAIAGVRLD